MDAAPVAAKPAPAPAPAQPQASAPPGAPAAPAPGKAPAKPPSTEQLVGALVKGATMLPQAVSSTGAIMAQLVGMIDEKGDVPPGVAESLKRLSIIATLTDTKLGDPATAGPLPAELTADPVRGIQVLEQSLVETIGKLTTAFDGAGQSLAGAKLSKEQGEQLSQAAAVVEQARTAVWAAVKLVPPATTDAPPSDGAPAQPVPQPAQPAPAPPAPQQAAPAQPAPAPQPQAEAAAQPAA